LQLLLSEVYFPKFNLEEVDAKPMIPVLANKCGYEIVLTGHPNYLYVSICYLVNHGVKIAAIVHDKLSKAQFYGISTTNFNDFLEKHNKNGSKTLVLWCHNKKNFENSEVIIDMYRRVGCNIQFFDIYYSYVSYAHYIKRHAHEIINFYDTLADVRSKMLFTDWIDCILHEKYPARQDLWSYNETKYADPSVMRLTEDEHIVNIGGNKGDTFANFVNDGVPFKKFYCIEGADHMWTAAQNFYTMLSPDLQSKIEWINLFVDDINTIDCILGDQIVTNIALDVEGLELNLLNGGKKIIETYRPVLSISFYHKPEDLVELPNFVYKLKDYKYYLRKYVGLRIGEMKAEMILYAVPYERLCNAEVLEESSMY
jgi:hypothetical protein